MRWLRKMHSILRQFVSGRLDEADLDAEVRACFDLFVDEKVAGGMDREAAIRATRLECGRIEHLKEVVREQRHGAYFGEFLRDFRLAVRMLARRPAYAAVALITLGIGIGSTSAIYSVAYTLFGSTVLEVRESHDVVMVLPRDGDTYSPVGYEFYRAILDNKDEFSEVAAYRRGSAVLTLDGRTKLINLEFDTGNYFHLLGVIPAIGRTLDGSDSYTAETPSVMISFDLWMELFGGRESEVLDQSLRVGGRSFRIVGVAPEGFVGVQRDWYSPTDVWLPLSTEADSPQGRGLFVLARLRPEADLSSVRGKLESSLVGSSELLGTGDSVSLDLLPVDEISITPGRRARTEAFVSMLAAVSVVVLLASCFSIANFLIAQSFTRREEFAVRLAVGASRPRIIRQLMTESLVLAFGGAILSLFVAMLVFRIAGSIPNIALRVPVAGASTLNLTAGWELNGLIIVASLILMVASFLGFGFLPALSASAREPFRGETKFGKRSWIGFRMNTREILLVLQIAIAMILAVTAVLHVKSFGNAMAVAHGDAKPATLLVRLMTGLIDSDERASFYAALTDELDRLPAVSTSLGVDPPYSIGRDYVSLPGTPDQRLEVGASYAGPNYFASQAIHLVEGREFSSEDRLLGRGIIINTVLADKLWPDQRVVGHILGVDTATRQEREVIGVVEFDRCRDILGPPSPCVWRPFSGFQDGYLHIQTDVGPDEIAPSVEHIVRSIHPEVAISEIRTMDNYVEDLIAVQRASAWTTGSLAILTIVLVAVACFALFASIVTHGRHEQAIRTALGASPRVLLAQLLLRSLTLGVCGSLLGLLGMVMLSRTLSAQLFEVSALDPSTLFLAVACVNLIALSASYFAARFSMRSSPAEVLNHY